MKLQISKMSFRLSIVAIILLVSLFCVMSSDERSVALPVICCFSIFTVFFTRTWGRSRELPIWELGIVYSFVVLIYCSVPIIGYILKGMTYKIGGEARLFEMQPLPDEVTKIGWYGVLYLLSFVASYSFTKRRSERKKETREIKDKPPLAVILAPILLLLSYFLLLGIFYPMEAKTYRDTYLVYWALPLVTRQFTNHLSGMLVVAKLVLLVILFLDYKRNRIWIVLFLTYHIVSTLGAMGSRSELVQYFVAVMLLYHRFVKKLKVYTVAIFSIIGLGGIIIYGEVRSIYHRGGELDKEIDMVAMPNEFEGILATACELNRARRYGKPNVPLQLYLSDLFSPIPSQLLPFEKMSYSRWYLKEFHPETREAGGGYAFGVLSESAAGFGLPQLILLGIAVGVAFALLQKRYMRKKHKFWNSVLNLWLCVECYQSFRSTSFIILTYFLYHYVTLYIFVHVFTIWKRSGTRERAETLDVEKTG